MIDGIVVGDPHVGTRGLNLSEVESLEYLAPLDASRWGMDAGAFGALVVWTRGQGPYKSAARNRN